MDKRTKTTEFQCIGGGNYESPELNVIDLHIEGAICFDSGEVGGQFNPYNEEDAIW